MAVKKPDTARDDIEPVEVNSASKVEALEAPAPAVAKPAASKVAKADTAEFCVYLGPTIHGVIQSGTVYAGNRASTEKLLASAIEKRPLIAKLIVTDKTLAEDRVKVKTAGNLLNVLYMRLASGKSV